MNLRRTSTTAGRLAVMCVLTGATLGLGAGAAGAATTSHTAPTVAAVPAYHGPHGGGGHWRGGGGHWRGGGGYYRGGDYDGYYDNCDPYYYGYYDLDNPTCD